MFWAVKYYKLYNLKRNFTTYGHSQLKFTGVNQKIQLR